MTSLLQKVMWWVQRRRKEDELREELQFHLDQEADELHGYGLPEDQAKRRIASGLRKALRHYCFEGRFNITKQGASDRATTTSGHSSPFRSPAAIP